VHSRRFCLVFYRALHQAQLRTAPAFQMPSITDLEPPPPMTLDPSNPRNPKSINVTQHGLPASTQLTSRRSDKVQGLPLRHNVVPKTSTDPGQIPLSTAVSHAQLANDRAGTQGSCRRLPSRTHHGLQHPRASDATGRRVRTGSWVVRQGGMDLRIQCPKSWNDPRVGISCYIRTST
jgi:hypothetical protein